MNSVRKSSLIGSDNAPALRGGASFAVLIVFAALLAACQRTHESMGSESHFLVRCTADAACGPFSCISGRCTQACVTDAQCVDVAPHSVCVATPTGQPGETRTACGIVCKSDARVCSAISPDLSCRSGQCLPAAVTAVSTTPTQDAGLPTTTSTAGSGGTGTVATIPSETPASSPATASGDTLTADVISARSHCGMITVYEGDDACLPPPDPALGIQIHIGPSDYDDPLQLQAWQLEPGEEATNCYSFAMPNGAAVTFAEWELSARPGLHTAFFGFDRLADPAQICSTMHEDGHQGMPGSLLADRPHIARQEIPTGPLRVGANALGVVALHAFDVTDRPVLRELWLNLYYAK